MRVVQVTDQDALPAARMLERVAAAHAQAGRTQRAAEIHEQAASEFVRAGAFADAIVHQSAAKALRAGSVTTAATSATDAGAPTAKPAPSTPPSDGSEGLVGQALYAWRLTHGTRAPAPASEAGLVGQSLYAHRLAHPSKK